MKAAQNKEALPYERFLKNGPDSLTDAELLAIILRTGTKEKNAMELAQDILSLHGGAQGRLVVLHQITVAELKHISGIGEVKAVKVKAICELALRMARQSLKTEDRLDAPQLVADYYMERMRHYTVECVMLLMLDSRGHFLGDMLISQGTVNASLISPREIFIAALKQDASGIILIHNHPSGDPTPSQADIQLTGQVKACGKLMNIPLIDHIIIGDHTYSSFKELELI